MNLGLAVSLNSKDLVQGNRNTGELVVNGQYGNQWFSQNENQKEKNIIFLD